MVAGDFGVEEQLLWSLASITEEMGAAAQICRSYRSVQAATAGCFIQRCGYMNNEMGESEQVVSFEAWIEIVGHTQRSTTCYLELKIFKDRWVLDRDIFENIVDGREEILSLPEVEFNDFGYFKENIGDLTRELTGALPELIA